MAAAPGRFLFVQEGTRERAGRRLYAWRSFFFAVDDWQGEPVALFVRIDPVARRGQRKTTFDQSCHEDRAKPQAAHVGCFEHAQTVSIRRAKDLRLRGERATHFL